MKPILRSFTADNDEILAVIKTNCFLAIAISLGLRIDGRDLYAPNEYVVFPFLSLHPLILAAMHLVRRSTFFINNFKYLSGSLIPSLRIKGNHYLEYLSRKQQSLRGTVTSRT